MSKHQFLLAFDQGTTGSTTLVLDATDKMNVKVIGKSTSDFAQYYPKTSWVEHNLDEIWDSIKKSAIKAMKIAKKNNSNFNQDSIVAIGITNQRETVCFFDKKTSAPLSNAIVWQCKRSIDICKSLKESGIEQEVREKTGLVLDPYFSGSKISWAMENDPNVATDLRKGTGLVGTIDTWLIHKLTAAESFVTEPSNASRTLLFDIHKGEWDSQLLELFRIPSIECLAEVKPSAGIFGETKGLDFLRDGIPISGVLGDQQAALFGQACFQVGEAKCTYGTGAFLLVNKGDSVELSKHGLLTTVAWSLDGKLTYAFEGSAFIAGAAIQFLRDQFHFLKDVKESEAMAEEAIAAPELYFVPALAGLGAPYWEPHVKGGFLGLTRGTTTNEIVRAALEGIAFQVTDLVKALESDLDKKISVLNVDGGAVANNILMQTQAEYLETEVRRPENLETTAFGAAMAAALGVGIYSNLDEIKQAKHIEKVFIPESSEDQKEKISKQLAGWKKAVKAMQLFAE